MNFDLVKETVDELVERVTKLEQYRTDATQALADKLVTKLDELGTRMEKAVELRASVAERVDSFVSDVERVGRDLGELKSAADATAKKPEVQAVADKLEAAETAARLAVERADAIERAAVGQSETIETLRNQIVSLQDAVERLSQDPAPAPAEPPVEAIR